MIKCENLLWYVYSDHDKIEFFQFKTFKLNIDVKYLLNLIQNNSYDFILILIKNEEDLEKIFNLVQKYKTEHADAVILEFFWMNVYVYKKIVKQKLSVKLYSF